MKKQVIKTESLNQIDFNAVSEEKYYGVQIGDDKGFIVQSQYKEGEFNIVCRAGLTYHNFFTNYHDFELKRLVRDVIFNNCLVYQFDTYQELFIWLAGDES